MKQPHAHTLKMAYAKDSPVDDAEARRYYKYNKGVRWLLFWVCIGTFNTKKGEQRCPYKRCFNMTHTNPKDVSNVSPTIRQQVRSEKD
jgi:hypothetical protein